MEEIREQLVEVRASLEASIDFGDDVEICWGSIRSAVTSVIGQLSSVEKRVHRGTLIANGLNVVILGQTNVGKSSLFNHIGIFVPVAFCLLYHAPE